MALAGFALSEPREYRAEVLVKPFCFQAAPREAGRLLCSPQMLPQCFGAGNHQAQPQCPAGPRLEVGLWAVCAWLLRRLRPHLCFVCGTGGFGVDFSLATDDFRSGIDLVGRKILSHGVTSFCPTLVTSPPSVYHQVSDFHRLLSLG